MPEERAQVLVAGQSFRFLDIGIPEVRCRGRLQDTKRGLNCDSFQSLVRFQKGIRYRIFPDLFRIHKALSGPSSPAALS